MADIVIDTDDTDGFVFSTADSTLTLNAGITLTNAGVALDASALADGRIIAINGTINETAGNSFRGAAIDVNGALSSVVISETGRVKSERVGIQLAGDNSSIDIIGTVISGATGVTMDGQGSSLTVSGKLRSSTTAIVMGEGFEDQTITNTGLIRGENIGFSMLGEGTLINEKGGAITGPKNFGSDSTQEIFNKGTINGDIFLEGGNDIYDGRGGTLNGRVFGGDGGDIYLVDDAKTRIRENEDEGSRDTVFTSVTYSLGDNFEFLVLEGTKDLNGFGNGLDNALAGNSGRNRLAGRSGIDSLQGLGGRDILAGGKGQDSLLGGTGGDTFVFATGDGRDIVSDFAIADGDRIDLSRLDAVTSFADLKAHHMELIFNVLIITAGEDVLTLFNIDNPSDFADLGKSDFIF